MKVLDFSGFIKIYESQDQIEAGIIGDSSVVMYKYLVPELEVFPGLSKGGWQIGNLLEAVKGYYRTHPEVNLLFIGIGSNDLYIVNNKNIEAAKELRGYLNRIFPNAKFIVVKGGWGWGALIDGPNSPVNGYTGSSDPSAMDDYYERVWKENGFKVMNASQGYSPEHHTIRTPKIIEQSREIKSILGGKGGIYSVANIEPEEPLSERDLTEFYDVLQGVANGQKILSQQPPGNYSFLTEVKALQVGLEFLGYSLPVWGVDGLYGPETAGSVSKFKSQYGLGGPGNTFDSGDAISLIEALKEKGLSPQDLEKIWKKSYQMASGGSPVDLTGEWPEITKQLLVKYEGFSDKAGWDENAYRGGYGTDKIIKNGQLLTADANTTWTRQEALDTLDYEIKNTYGPIVAQSLGSSNWGKLNDKQKAALVSLGYNVGPYFASSLPFGRRIKEAIAKNDMELASAEIANGPSRGAVSGKYYSALKTRRNEEAQIFLA